MKTTSPRPQPTYPHLAGCARRPPYERACPAASLNHARRAESSSGHAGNTVWRDLSGHWNDIDVAPRLMARRGGHYECAAGRALRIADSPYVREALEADFTLTVVCEPHSEAADAARHNSYLPISLGGGALQFGAAESRSSLPLACGSCAPHASILYPPGTENKPGSRRVHQFSCASSAGGRMIKYYADGALIGNAA